jgi:hypothetical protein
MRITWFAATTLRLHIGGQILVSDPGMAPEFIDRRELVAGADRTFGLAEPDDSIPSTDALRWRPRPVPKVIDEPIAAAPVEVLRLAGSVILVAAVGEPRLLLLATREVPPLGRWVDDSVAVLLGDAPAIVTVGTALLALHRPRLIAIAPSDGDVDAVFVGLGDRLDGVSLVSLEPGLALEA